LGKFYLIQNNGIESIRYYIKIEGSPKTQIEVYTFILLTPYAYQIIESNYGNKFVKENKDNPFAFMLSGDEYEEDLK
jgi:hypothetical protein